MLAAIDIEQTLTQTIANISVLVGIFIGIGAWRKAKKEARKTEITERGDLIEGATGYTQILMTRISELESKVEEMQKKQDEINEARIKAERDSAEWKIRYENEHELRITAETRALTAETELRLTGYRRRSDTDIIHDIKKKEAKDFLDDEPKL